MIACKNGLTEVAALLVGKGAAVGDKDKVSEGVGEGRRVCGW